MSMDIGSSVSGSRWDVMVIVVVVVALFSDEPEFNTDFASQSVRSIADVLAPVQVLFFVRSINANRVRWTSLAIDANTLMVQTRH